MHLEHYYLNGTLALKVKGEKDHIQVHVAGAELFQLTDKSNGGVSLIAFESKFAANRFFSENTGYFFTKIL